MNEVMNISNALPPSVLKALSDLDAMEKDNDDTLAAMGKGNKTKGGGGDWRSTAPIPTDDAAVAPDLNESSSNSSNATNGTTTRAGGGASGGVARNGTDWRSIDKVNELHALHDYAWHDYAWHDYMRGMTMLWHIKIGLSERERRTSFALNTHS
jgi:hypothetical protein